MSGFCEGTWKVLSLSRNVRLEQMPVVLLLVLGFSHAHHACSSL